jgi:hypothetical protein
MLLTPERLLCLWLGLLALALRLLGVGVGVTRASRIAAHELRARNSGPSHAGHKARHNRQSRTASREPASWHNNRNRRSSYNCAEPGTVPHNCAACAHRRVAQSGKHGGAEVDAFLCRQCLRGVEVEITRGKMLVRFRRGWDSLGRAVRSLDFENAWAWIFTHRLERGYRVVAINCCLYCEIC